MYKKIVACLTCFIICLSLVACSLTDNKEMLEKSKDTINTLSQNISSFVDKLESNISDIPYMGIDTVRFDGIGKSLLTKEQQKQYDDFSEYIYKLESDMSIDNLTKDNVSTIIEYYRSDNPQVFWIANKYEYDYNKVTLEIQNFSIEYHYLDLQTNEYVPYTKEMIEVMSEMVEEKANEILSGITSDMSDFDKVKYVHDYLVQNVKYDKTGNFQHNIYGALVENRAVCDGYSFANMYLLSKLGIECQMIYGSSLDDEAHAWNIVTLDGKPYHVDVTWDVPSNGSDHIIYPYFLVSDEVIKKDHVIDSPSIGNSKKPDNSYIPVPECTNDDYNYYKYNQLYISSFNEQNINMFLSKLENAVENKSPNMQFQFASADVLQDYVDAIQKYHSLFKEKFPYTTKDLTTNCVSFTEKNILYFGFEYLD